ncbi:MAG: hypothetical protein HKM03_10550, partial [Steroidobacteraceae bacterium]|nr:hypothetical protein [Steroidobacteraceae bacterium]
MFLRRLAKILGRLAAGLLVLGIVATLALNFALDRVPRYQTEIKAWVHQQTGLHVRFAHVAATLRWYGPELSFRQLELRSRDDRRVLAKTARGRIGWDLWRLLASGRLFAGRIELDSPDIVVARIGPTRFAPASEQSLQSGGKAVAGFRLADLPPGILVIRHGRVSVTGWNRQLPRLTLHDVNLQVRRDADAIHLRFDAVLPAVLGGKLNLRGRLGNVGASPAALDWSADLRTRNVSFRGWRRLLPAYLDHLKSGSGAFELKANGIGHDLGDANFDFEATNVAARSNDGSTAKFDRIGGHLELAHQGDRWTLLGRHVQALRSGRVDPPSQFEVTWRAKRGGGFHLRARASYLRADNLLPLAALLPRKSSRERLIAISPTGEWRNASLRLERLRAGDHWHFTVHAQFRDAGFGAFGRTPGLRGLSGSVAGDQRAGHVTFSTHAATLAWPAQWPRPVRLDALGGTVFWSRTPAGLLMATPRTVMANDDGRVSLLASML